MHILPARPLSIERFLPLSLWCLLALPLTACGSSGSGSPGSAAGSGSVSAGAASGGAIGVGLGGAAGLESTGGSGELAGAPAAGAGSPGGAGRGGAGRGGASNSAGAGGSSGYNAGGAANGGAAASGHLDHVFVIALENHDEGSIIGNTTDAPYLNGLLSQYSSAGSFKDELPKAILSEPHYVWMESGTNAFADHTFDSDDPPSAKNSTADTEHLSTQLDAAQISWLSFQEGLDATTGACPVAGSGFYLPKHDPFVFFQDVSGSTPSMSNARCAAHHQPLSSLGADLMGTMPSYAFITPNLCHDMHGAVGCPDANTIHAGDSWLSLALPPLIAYVKSHAGVVFITWDEGENTLDIPFLAIGPTVKHGYVGMVQYTHSSLLKTTERILGVPVLPRVASANDFSDLFAQQPF